MKKVKKTYIYLLAICTCLSLTFLYLATTFKIERKIIYNEKGNIDYKVYLKENEYFDEKYLEKDRKYISSLIDYFDILYKYEFESNHTMNYKCNYYLVASSLVKEKNDTGKVIYEKEKYLLNNKTKEFNNSRNFNVEEEIKITYDDYNNIIKNFISKYNLLNTNSTLSLSLYVNLEGQGDGFEGLIVDKSLLTITIPLTDQTVDINIEYKEIDNVGEKIEFSSNNIPNIVFWILFIICALLDIIFVFLFLKNFRCTKKKSKYEKNKIKLIHQYNRAIVKVDKAIDVKYYEIIEVSDFIDLLNVRDCLEKPILFMEVEKYKTSWFIVLDDKILYRFIFDAKNNDNDDM